MRALLLEHPDTAHRLLLPFVWAMAVAGVLVGIFINDNTTEVVSAILLLITSVICRRILDLRRPKGAWMFLGPWRIWAFVSLGFVFLAFDEILSIHEKLDELIHAVGGFNETALSDRIDDLIILVYGMIGLVLLYAHRSEFRRLTDLYKYLIAGFVLLFLMVAVDALNNRTEYMDLLNIESPAMRALAAEITKDAEEVFKIASEAVFLFGFLAIFSKFYNDRLGSEAPRQR